MSLETFLKEVEKRNEISKADCKMAHYPMEKDIPKLLRIVMDLHTHGKRLLERIDFNGGLGEYKGGPAFVVKEFRDCLKRCDELADE